MSLWVKICGIREPQDAQASVDAGADAIGLNFYAGSRRYCAPESVASILARVPADFPVFGVFVDSTRGQIQQAVQTLGLRGVQLHGNEPLELARGWDLPLIRAVKASDTSSVAREIEAAGGAWRVLVDNPAGGGTGKLVDEGVLEHLALAEVVLAGGLTPANVAARVSRLRPFGVDVAGGVETSPGLKDHQKIREFIEYARAA